MEASAARAPFQPEERRQLQALAEWFNKEGRSPSQAPLPTSLPATKPAYSGIRTDNDGRIWLKRFVPAVKVDVEAKPRPVVGNEDGTPRAAEPKVSYQEPPVFAAFGLDGHYLGEVRFPLGATHVAFVGDVAWAVIKGEDDQDMLVKYRLPRVTPRRKQE
jgi:hypothetical protein